MSARRLAGSARGDRKSSRLTVSSDAHEFKSQASIAIDRD